MTDLSKENQPSIPYTREILCSVCGRRFLFRGFEQETFARRGWEEPRRCMACRKAAQELRRKEEERRENEKWQLEKEKEKKIFHEQLKDWKVVSKDEIQPKSDRVLYILGNGFDLMHRVRSNYYAFRDTLGKHNQLRFMLENYLTPEDIWADFEDALAHFNISAMGNRFLVGEWLDLFEAFDEDAGFAEFSMACEAAANPILTVVEELPRRFRKWVETLAIGTDDRPLQDMFRNGKVLCFNYTEFVETLYGISEENVCYIHGCRRKKKYHPKEKLILGHLSGASEDEYDFVDDSPVQTKDPYKLYMIEAAQENVMRLISESDEALTKNCDDIIAEHKAFFMGLSDIEDIIVIGHSFSAVDWAYFSEIATSLSDARGVHWYFGCHGLRDLNSLEKLLKELRIERSDVSVFRTDDITVTPLKDDRASSSAPKSTVAKTRCTTLDGKWAVKTSGNTLSIVNRETDKADYEVMFPSFVNNVFFGPTGKHLFGVIKGSDPGIFLFGIKDGHWRLLSELQSIPNQGIINRRLNHVFLTDREVIFVYNNRVRKYSLADGMLVANQPRRNAGSLSYEGENISHLFLKRT